MIVKITLFIDELNNEMIVKKTLFNDELNNEMIVTKNNFYALKWCLVYSHKSLRFVACETNLKRKEIKTILIYAFLTL